MKVFVLNGWVASPDAWRACMFPKDRIFDYIEALDGLARDAFMAEDRSVLVGWSMGGSIALGLAAEAPRKVAGLVLVSATPRMMAAKGWAGMSPGRLRALEYGFTHGLGAEGPYVKDTPQRMKRGLDYLEQTDLRMDLIDLMAKGPLDFPVYIFQSERDAITRASNAEFLKAVFPEAVCEIVPGSDHALPVSIPERIDAAVADCLIECKV